MVDIAAARSDGSTGMFVPVEKIDRERKRPHVWIFKLRTPHRGGKELAFARSVVGPE